MSKSSRTYPHPLATTYDVLSNLIRNDTGYRVGAEKTLAGIGLPPFNEWIRAVEATGWIHFDDMIRKNPLASANDLFAILKETHPHVWLEISPQTEPPVQRWRLQTSSASERALSNTIKIMYTLMAHPEMVTGTWTTSRVVREQYSSYCILFSDERMLTLTKTFLKD